MSESIFRNSPPVGKHATGRSSRSGVVGLVVATVLLIAGWLAWGVLSLLVEPASAVAAIAAHLYMSRS